MNQVGIGTEYKVNYFMDVSNTEYCCMIMSPAPGLMVKFSYNLYKILPEQAEIRNPWKTQQQKMKIL